MRMARILMSAMLLSGGCPWTVIRVEDHDGCMARFEPASFNQNIKPFAQFLADRTVRSLAKAP